MENRVLAIDLGASSGRGIAGWMENGKLICEEVFRFSNDPVELGDTYYWDFLRLFYEIQNGLRSARREFPIGSVGIDTWGVDYGLLKDGRLLANPRHYRDQSHARAAERVLAGIPMDVLYERVGIQYQPFNTIFQLNTEAMAASADTLLLIPDLLAYYLCGATRAEYTIASTTGLLDPVTRDWDWELIRRLGYPASLFQPVVQPGTVLGRLYPQILGEEEDVQVIAAASHDTASAYAAASGEEGWAVLSSGTWSLLGCEIREPIRSSQALRANFTNEGGVNGTIRFLQNIMGTWLIQQCRAWWMRKGEKVSFADLEHLARSYEGEISYIDVDDSRFSAPGDIPGRIAAFCRESGQRIPDSVAAVMRCIYESLALKYRLTIERLSSVTGKSIRGIQMVGGGIRDSFLCQLTADYCGIPLLAGPMEAASIGNVAVQMIAGGIFSSLEEARAVIRSSFPQKRYEPAKNKMDEENYQKYIAIIE